MAAGVDVVVNPAATPGVDRPRPVEGPHDPARPPGAAVDLYWLLEQSGVPTDGIELRPGGRAPGWDAGRRLALCTTPADDGTR